MVTRVILQVKDVILIKFLIGNFYLNSKPFALSFLRFDLNMKEHYKIDIKKARPEEKYDTPLAYFRGDFLDKYANSKAIMNIQEKITKRAVELLEIDKRSSKILDLGCGPGFSSLYLSIKGYNVVALDFNPRFLYFYDLREINPILADMTLLPFKESSFHAVISISALQWISKERKKLLKLFNLLNRITRNDAKLVFQFYPRFDDELEKIKEIVNEFTLFDGYFVIDNPHSPKKRKIYLLLQKSH